MSSYTLAYSRSGLSEDSRILESKMNLNALKWRNIGPFRGGRVTAVAGHQDQLFTYYMGVTGGGVWKTEDGGAHWRNISDGFFKTSSVGAITVSKSDPNVIYVGMGESPVRPVKTTHGDGVYKSIDGGRTWKKMGLELTRHISKISVHPNNPNIVYVAAQGNQYAASKERGVYKTIDGGKNWTQVLFVNETSGANDICIDVNNPEIIYVAMWDHHRKPWQFRSGGPGSSILKSLDGGEHWETITNGLPQEMGKIGVTVSPANSDRVWAIVEAEKGGLYRSDNGGTNWRLLNDERVIRTRSWYYMHIFADPQDEETVYILNAPMMKSTDGGKTFKSIRIPHIDNHDLWINPKNNKIMVQANDGGANISFNGGKTWSTQWNQPTAQFYRVNTDNDYFYKVYGGQQDNSTVAISSRTRHYGVGRQDWFSCGGAENANIAVNPDDPGLIYSTGGRLTEYNVANESTRNIGAYPRFDLASKWDEIKYRFSWNAPVLLSVHDDNTLYHAAQFVMKSPDKGKTWTEISPDLTRNQKEKQVPGCVPFTNEGAGGELYNTITFLAECPHNKGTIWAGTDDGLVHVTRNDGNDWENVTPKGLGEAIINTIEVSPHNCQIVYLSILKHKFNDLKPYIYKTTNGGKTWELVVKGIASEDYVRVVREDPVKPGLLFAGTLSGVYYSQNGGASWQFLQSNLPVVPVTDLKIQHSDLVAATEGRAFWILDDISPLRQQIMTDIHSEPCLFSPSDAYLISQKSIRDELLAKNPPNGAIIYYFLPNSVDLVKASIKCQIYDEKDLLIRTMDINKKNIDHGLNRLVWDLRTKSREVKSVYFFFAGYKGIKVLPGKYKVKLTVNNKSYLKEVNVYPDPEYSVTDEYLYQYNIMEKAFLSLTDMHTKLNQLNHIREQLNCFNKEHSIDEIQQYSKNILLKIDSVEQVLTQPKQTTIQDVINYTSGIDSQYGYLIEQIDEAGMQIVYGAEKRFNDLETEWKKNRAFILGIFDDLSNLNQVIEKKSVPRFSIQKK